ncbi:hypothetical protein V1477_007057 [Vespula maculifrons]|uniref:Uncharacterized protein n=1 Tax=Vespula maculifrons TaxID=7453 RepID=A0ABD2CHG5_VESMC
MLQNMIVYISSGPRGRKYLERPTRTQKIQHLIYSLRHNSSNPEEHSQIVMKTYLPTRSMYSSVMNVE